MQNSLPTIPIDFVHDLLQGAALDPHLQAACVLHAGIAPALLQQAGARVTNQQFAGLYRLLAQQCDDETPGMFARPLRGGTLKFLCLSLIGSPSLVTALYRARRVHVCRSPCCRAARRCDRTPLRRR